jgi:ABC-type antimicrobial peptide transport system permease subunit
VKYLRNILGKIAIKMNKRIFATTIGISLCVMYLVGTMAMVTGLHTSTKNAADLFDEGFIIVYEGFTLSESEIPSETIEMIPGKYAKCAIVVADVEGTETRVMSINDPHNLLGGENITLVDEILPGKSFPQPTNATSLNFTTDTASISINISSNYKPFTSPIFPDHWILASEDTIRDLNPELEDSYSFIVIPSDNNRALEIIEDMDFNVMQSVSVVKYFELGFYQVEDNLWGVVISSTLIIVILVYNIMRIEIQYRVPDIKIIKYLGASPLKIMSVFILQALFISLVGAVVGLSLGIMAANAIVSGSQFLGFASVLVPQITLYTMGFPLLMALLAGLVGGLLPAYKASKTTIRTSREVL